MNAAPDAELLGQLDLVRRRRAPYDALLAEVVADTLAHFPPLPGKPVLEIGAGTGQLRGWLPSALRERMLHTDPSEAALQALRERAPDAKTRAGRAEQLPAADAGAGAVLGLCVLDAVGDPARAAGEIERVLAPGGRFIHFADMATLLEGPFAKLAASGLCPLPNVFGDPGDYEWPLDVVLVKRDWMAGLLSFASGAGHPLAAVFGGFFGALLAEPLDAGRATAVWKAVAASGSQRGLLRGLLESAGQAAFACGFPAIAPLPFHSGLYLKSMLDTTFQDRAAFRVERSEIVPRAAWSPRADPHAPRYRSLCLGHERVSGDLPARRLAPEPHEPPDAGAPAGPTLTEVGIFVFVAVRRDRDA